mmetsp:Transcript_13979/g.40224  ORF Transcript_13979/g.40224 Transcript_13979/m.40224 type:complete len:376 (+) Transcript_13979:1351-2478(+)
MDCVGDARILEVNQQEPVVCLQHVPSVQVGVDGDDALPGLGVGREEVRLAPHAPALLGELVHELATAAPPPDMRAHRDLAQLRRALLQALSEAVVPLRGEAVHTRDQLGHLGHPRGVELRLARALPRFNVPVAAFGQPGGRQAVLGEELGRRRRALLADLVRAILVPSVQRHDWRYRLLRRDLVRVLRALAGHLLHDDGEAVHGNPTWEYRRHQVPQGVVVVLRPAVAAHKGGRHLLERHRRRRRPAGGRADGLHRRGRGLLLRLGLFGCLPEGLAVAGQLPLGEHDGRRGGDRRGGVGLRRLRRLLVPLAGLLGFDRTEQPERHIGAFHRRRLRGMRLIGSRCHSCAGFRQQCLGLSGRGRAAAAVLPPGQRRR